jgi:hypothetical protein
VYAVRPEPFTVLARKEANIGKFEDSRASVSTSAIPIPGGMYSNNPQPAATYGVMATLVVSAKQPDDVGNAQGHTDPKTATTVDLEALVAEADMGGRRPTGGVASFLFCVDVAWSLFQLWYASPLAFTLGFGVFNDTQARAIHLAFALVLAFAGYPAFKSSPRNRVPLFDWLLATAGSETVPLGSCACASRANPARATTSRSSCA